jgi:hypothetical protein
MTDPSPPTITSYTTKCDLTVVEALREPRPDDAAVSDHPAMGRRRRVPLFLHLRAVKPTIGFSGPA